MKKITAAITLFLLISTQLFAVTEIYDDSSTVAGKFLDLKAGAAAGGMGNAYINSSVDAGAAFWNPAGLSNMIKEDKEWSMFFSHNVWIMDMMIDHFSAASYFPEYGVFALSASYFNAGAIERYDIDGNGLYISSGTYSPYSLMTALAYSNHLDKDIDFGINLKYIYDNIDGSSAHAYAIDMGLRYFSPIDGLNFGLTASNFSGSLNGFILPKEMSFAVSYSTEIQKFGIDAEYNIIGKVNNYPLHRIGLQIAAPSVFTARFGYQTDNTLTENGFRNLTLGIGLDFDGRYIDFSYEPFGDIGNSFKLSIGGGF
ncbi:MAG: PorV/PorQ family protein [Candidatus Goldiibacteriota bacterium]